MNRTTSKKSTIVVILLLSCLALSGVFTGAYYISRTGSLLQMDINNIQKVIVSSKDDSSHMVNINFSIELLGSYAKDADSSLIRKSIEKAVSNLDYAQLTEKNNIDYILENVKYELNKIVPEDKIYDLYITDIHADFTLDSNNNNSTNKNLKIYKGLFEKMQ